MPRTVTTGLYDFDPLMKNTANRIVNEKQTLVVPGRDDFHFLIPQAAPFFVEDVTVRNETTGETYYEGTDYVFGHWFVEGMNKTGRSIAGSIRFLRREIAGIIVLDYHTLGGQWGFDDQAITRELSQRSINPLVRAWAQIDVLPALFPPIAHDQRVDKLVGFQDVVDGLDGIVAAINASQTGSTSDHIAARDNPHDVTKTQVGLGNVQNYPVATNTEARMGARTDRYMTPRTTREAIEEIGLGALTTHVNDKNNPHQVTQTQVGLGNVQNYSIASVGDATARLRNDRYMTPLRTGQAIDRWYADNLAGFFDGTVQNATGVTAQQIGLGSVENFGIATDTEAVAGVANDKYMTPLRTYQAIDRFAIVPMNTHIDDKFNPHNVTKAQVGLSEVQNFPVATNQQAREGTATNAYMTPALVAAAISSNAGSDLGNHLNDFDNPHQVTKSQVGLSNVENYLIATQAQATEGTSNEHYMTPLRVVETITAKVGADFSSHVNNSSNPHNVTKSQVGLGNVDNFSVASQSEARVGTANNRYMTPTRVKEAIEAQAIQPFNVHIADTSNPHSVTKAQVGLGSVEDYSVATKDQAEEGTSNEHYMTPLRVREAVHVLMSGDVNTHVTNTSNPHQVTKSQVGLGSVDNYGTATKAQAEAGTANNRFMTPLRVKEAIESIISDDVNAHVADRNNPHNVTKSQVSLGNVENYSIATEQEAKDGDTNSKYMTPLRVKDAVGTLIGNAFDTHVNNSSNPHNVTKAQVGLNNVENYRIASSVEAQALTRTDRYLTPATLGDALSVFRDDLTEFFFNNEESPLEVNKDQIGLGNVENYSIASRPEAETGSSNVRYMTPLRTAEAISHQVGGTLSSHISNESNPHNVNKDQVGLGSVENYGIATQQDVDNGVSDKYMTPENTQYLVGGVEDDLADFISRRDNPHGVTAEQIDVYSKQDIDNFLDDKLNSNAAATNALAVYGLSKEQLLDEFSAEDANNAIRFDGNTYDDMIDYIKTLKVADATLFDGQTKDQLSADIVNDVTASLLGGTGASVAIYELEPLMDGQVSSAMSIGFDSGPSGNDPYVPTSFDLLAWSNGRSYRFTVSGTPGNFRVVTNDTLPDGAIFEVGSTDDGDDEVSIWHRTYLFSGRIVVIFNDPNNSIILKDAPEIDNNVSLLDTITPFTDMSTMLASLEDAFKDAADELEA